MEYKDSPVQTKTRHWQKVALIILGVSLTLVLLELGLRFGGSLLLLIQDCKNRLSIREKATYRIMCIGESTTEDGYPYYLEEFLRGRQIGVKFSVINEGLPATNTSIIVNKLESNLNKYNPQMVIAMMGINDEGAHIPLEPQRRTKIMDFVSSFKVYKLARLLRLHMAKRAEKINLWLLNERAKMGLCGADAYFSLGKHYTEYGKYEKAEKLLKKSITIEPLNVEAYLLLARVYAGMTKYIEAEEWCWKAIAIDPANESAYLDLAQCHKVMSDYRKAIEVYKKAASLNPLDGYAYFEIADCYRKMGMPARAEKSLKKAIELEPNSERFCLAASLLYREMGRMPLADAYQEKADLLRGGQCNAQTYNNYLRCRDLLRERGIKLVCVQYPMRDIAALKNIFGEDSKGIIFVDNRGGFNEAVRQRGYRYYFIDMFGGDFGHCTETGKQLLASNIGNAILKEAFGK